MDRERLLSSRGGEAPWLPPQAPGGRPPAQWDKSAPPVVVPPPPPAGPPPGYGQAPATNGEAVAALVLGIVGLALTVLTAGLLFFINLPCSVLAIVFGRRARRRLASGETTAGRSHAQAGFVLGIVGGVVGVLALLAWAFLYVP